MITDVTRLEDMSAVGRLRVMLDDDGDVLVIVSPQSDDGLIDFGADIEFCTIGSGGGGSPKTYKALRALMVAMAEDNADENCQGRAPEDDES